MQKSRIVSRSMRGVWHWIVARGDEVHIVGPVNEYGLEEIIWALTAGI
jgi:hypothetical protein